MGVRDLGFFAQSLWNTLHGSFFAVSFGLQGPHLWSEHFYLAHLFLIPLYALWPSPLMLLAVQAATVGVTGWAVYLLGGQWLSRPWMAAVPVLAYTLHPSVHGAATGFLYYGYHPDLLFPPLFVLAIYFSTQRRARAVMTCWILGLSVLEHYAVIWIGLGLPLAAKRATRRLGIAMIAGSALWVAFATLVVIPRFAGGKLPYYFQGFPGLRFLTEVHAPVANIWQQIESHLMAMVRPLGFLPLLDPFTLITVPMYAVYASAWRIGHLVPLSPASWHNSAIIPVMMVSVLRMLGGISWFGARMRTYLGERGLAGILLAGTFLPLIFGPPLAARYGILPRDFTRLPEARRAALEEIARTIPNSAVLSTDFFTGSHFLNRPQLHLLRERWEEAEYILVDRLHAFGGLWPAERSALETVGREPGVRRVLDREGFLLLQRTRTQAAGSSPG